MANQIYNSFKKFIGDGGVDWDTDTIKVALVTSAYVPNIDSHTFFSDITNEVVGTGYTAGGGTLLNCAVTVDNSNDWAKYDADDYTWTTASITARGAVVYKSLGGDAHVSPVICYVDFGADKTSSAGDFTIQWHADGVFKLA